MIALDMDDTLLTDDLRITKENLKALEEANKKGVSIVFCSGRSSYSILKYLKDLSFMDMNDYYVSYNGAVINNVKGDNIFYKYISGESLSKLIKLGREYNVSVQLYNEDKIIVDAIKETTKKYEMFSGMKASVENLDDLKYSIKVLFNHNDIKVLDELKLELERLFGNRFHIFFSKPTYLEVLSIEANKGLALEYLSNKLYIKKEEIIAIGDSFNDIHMIQFAGLGVAMKNGRKELKEMADYTTISNNNDSGVAEVINKFVLEQEK